MTQLKYYDTVLNEWVTAVVGGGGGATLIPTAVQTADYNAVANDFVLCNATSSFTVTLPTTPADKTEVGVKMVAKTGTNVINVAPGGSDTIDSVAGDVQLVLVYTMITFQYEASTGNWLQTSTFLSVTGGLDSRYLNADNNLGDLTSDSAALANLGAVAVADLPVIYLPPSYMGDATGAQGANLNALLVTLSAAGGAHIIMPAGTLYTSVSIVMQANIWLEGAGQNTTWIHPIANSNCDTLQYQCYCPAATAWTSGSSTSYTARFSVITYLGNYYMCQVTHTSGTTTPGVDFYHWTVFSPVGAGTGWASSTKLSRLTLGGGWWLALQAAGDCHHAHNFACSHYDSLNVVEDVRAFGATGDAFHTTYGGVLTSNVVRYTRCYGDHCKGSGFIPAYDANAHEMIIGYNNVGGIYLGPSSSDCIFDGQIYNNGYAPAFMAESTAGATSGSITVGQGITSANPVTVTGLTLTSDMVNQGIFDGASPGAGVIPAGTYILDVLSTTTLLLSQAVTGTLNNATTLHIGGYYFQRTTSPWTPDACVDVTNGVLFYLLTAAPHGLSTAPSSDTTNPPNWVPIRSVPDWGWGATLWGGIWNSVRGNIQAHPRGAVQVANASNYNRVDVTVQNWQMNPVTGTNLISVPQNVTNLSASAMLDIGTNGASYGNVIHVVAANHTGSSHGSLLYFPNGTGNVVTVTSDANYANLYRAGGVPAGNSFNFNGVMQGFSVQTTTAVEIALGAGATAALGAAGTPGPTGSKNQAGWIEFLDDSGTKSFLPYWQ